MVTRRAGEGERHVRGGAWTGWRPTHMLGTQVSGKMLGLVGMGRIARAVAKRAHDGFGMRVIFHDPYPPPPDDAPLRSAPSPESSLEDVLREADFVSLHCPATPETRHLMNRERLALMRPDAFLINTARGDVVDEAALVEALQARTHRRRRARRVRAGATRVAGAARHGERGSPPAPRQRHHGDPRGHGHAGAGESAALLRGRSASRPRRVTAVVLEPFAAPPLPESADPAAASAAAYATEVVELLSALLLDLVRERQPEVEPVLRGERQVAS